MAGLVRRKHVARSVRVWVQAGVAAGLKLSGSSARVLRRDTKHGNGRCGEHTIWGPNMCEIPSQNEGMRRARTSLMFCYGMNCVWPPSRISRNRRLYSCGNLSLSPLSPL